MLQVLKSLDGEVLAARGTRLYALGIGRQLEICPKSEVGSRVSFRDQIETEAAMRL